ncbi:Ig-like domain-containing protein, partial [Myxococcota bacterium]|nr:Ig-like domain-containing protein [Myxococcota bacterium]
MRSLSRAIVAIALSSLTTTAGEAHANGLTTHTWISLRAIELLPEGPLKTLLSDETLRQRVVSGTIFPDGGYAIGDGYGELAHWEPFQLAYFEWIRDQYAPPFAAGTEAAEHVAFYLGLASHGIADQVFDSLYMERAKQLDASSDWSKSMDEATDVVFASKTGAQAVPPQWVPFELFEQLFRTTGPHDVEAATMKSGTNLAGLAVAVVGMLGADPAAVRDYSAQFPWATSHMTDVEIAGNPEHEAEVVAEYWQRQWARLHGDVDDRLVLATFPRDGALGHTRAASKVESRFSLVFARRLTRADVTPARFTLTDGAGVAHPFDVQLFYGNDSHVVHVRPVEDLAADTEYTITVLPGLPFTDGTTSTTPWSFRASTATPVTAEASSACTCVARAPAHGGLGV